MVVPEDKWCRVGLVGEQLLLSVSKGTIFVETIHKRMFPIFAVVLANNDWEILYSVLVKTIDRGRQMHAQDLR